MRMHFAQPAESRGGPTSAFDELAVTWNHLLPVNVWDSTEAHSMAMWNDQLRQTLRRLSRAPLFTAITLITLAIGVGANTVIFSVVEGVLLKPLPYPHPEQLIGVWHTAPGIGIKELNVAPSIYFINREQSATLQDIGAYDDDSFSVTGSGE